MTHDGAHEAAVHSRHLSRTDVRQRLQSLPAFQLPAGPSDRIQALLTDLAAAERQRQR
ncbi:MAG: hypothetical protein KJ947_22325 [Alphaproteobacteria bacterium]|jgi:hypothetical protein|nr:hypothetical protein [Alphaproteobacteria bacterium]MBU1552285.1 hypothetical protein [Alphaproteobacteria bacterium]MBU2336807.1 hypothetical protein [Alphaproteobacteria bacterium]MBU2389563.1 hypothetical protein [Alphaproteobacteria bacterium]